MSDIKHEELFSIRNSDFSYKDEIKPQAVLQILEEVAGRHAEELGIGYLDMKALNFAWVVVRTRVEITGSLTNGNNGYVLTYPSKPSRIDSDRNYIIYDMNHNECVKAIQKWIVIDYTSRRIQRLSSINFPEGASEETVLPSLSKIHLDENANLVNKVEIKTCINDLDHNGHVNNARYAEFVFNTFDLDEKRKLSAFECEYIKELKYNEDAYLMYDNTRENYALYNSNNELSFIMRIEWR